MNKYKNLILIVIILLLLILFPCNKHNMINCCDYYNQKFNFKTIKFNINYFLPPDQKESFAFFIPIDLSNDYKNEYLFYFYNINALNFKSARITPIIFNPPLLAPWSNLGNSFENSNPGQLVVLDKNRIILPEEIVEDNNNKKDKNSIRKNVSISAYDYNTGELIWRMPLENLNVVDLEHRYKLNLTKQGILYTSIDPFLLYCLDTDSGKIKWIYNAEEDFGNLSAFYHVPACMAYWRSFQFFVRYYYKDGIITYLSYSSKTDTPEKSKSIKKHLLISWDGKLISELKYEPLGFIEDKYIFYKEDINSNKYYIGLAKLADSSVIWQRKVPLKLSSSYPIENTYFLFNGKEISISEVPCEILTDYCFLLGGRNDKEDFVNCFSIKNGKEMWTYSLPKGSLSSMYPFEDKLFIRKGSVDNKKYSLVLLSKEKGEVLNEYPLKIYSDSKYNDLNEIFYVTKVFDNYLVFFRYSMVEILNNSSLIRSCDYEELSGSCFFGELDIPVPVITENEKQLILSIVPKRGGGATGGLILSFSKNENIISKVEDNSKDRQKKENNDLVTEEIAEDSEKNPNYNTAIGKLLSYLLPILTLVLLFVLFMIIFSRKMAHKHK